MTNPSSNPELKLWSSPCGHQLKTSFLDAIQNESRRNLMKQDDKGWVCTTEIAGKTYLLKKVAPDDKKLERWLKRLVKGSYLVSLLHRTARARKQGNQAPCEIYLVAEEHKFGVVKAAYVLMEYIEGTPLSELPNPSRYSEMVKETVYALHQSGLTSGDVHPGNFMLTDEGIRVIDLSGRGATAVSRAKDRYGMWRSFGIPNEIDDWAFRWVTLRQRARNTLRRLRGKKPLR